MKRISVPPDQTDSPRDIACGRRLPDADIPGIADARLLPDAGFDSEWEAIVLEGKPRLARQVAVGLRLRASVARPRLPLHGITLLSGPPGTGKTSLARGLASRVADAAQGMGTFLFVQIDPHGLVSSSLGRSQQRVDDLFRITLNEIAVAGPTIILFDEVETVLADRAALSLEANPFDVHRAVDAALTGLDRLAAEHPSVVILATSNYPDALDSALLSRVDLTFHISTPDASARDHILRDTVEAIASSFPGAGRALHDPEFRTAVETSAGLDGRRLRKAVAAACSITEGNIDPNNLRGEHLVLAVAEALQTLQTNQ